MIAYIKGTLAACNTDTIWVEAGGIGYEIYVSSSIFDYLPGIGQEVKIYTYLNVKEDLMQLFGFIDKEEQDLFKLLITVNGIGPKGALAILGCMSTDTLRFAILSGDAKTISKAPGIGAKTASRVILDLKDKLSLEEAFELKSAHVSEAYHDGDINEMRHDAIEALQALGYSATEALQAVKRAAVSEDMSSESLLKAALKEMMR